MHVLRCVTMCYRANFRTSKRYVLPLRVQRCNVTTHTLLSYSSGHTCMYACTARYSSRNYTSNETVLPGGDPAKSFVVFQELCARVRAVSSHKEKSAIVAAYLEELNKEDLCIWLRLMLPSVYKRVYHMKDKLLVKLFSQVFEASHSDMKMDLDLKGDVGETIRIFFTNSRHAIRPKTKSDLKLLEVDAFLENLSKETKQSTQLALLRTISERCTAEDLKMIVQLIKLDLKIGAGSVLILNGLSATANSSLKTTNVTIDQLVTDHFTTGHSPNTLPVVSPVKPMLAESCRSLEEVTKKCPLPMYAETKYDGERVQVHKQCDQFRYYSRSLRPVLQHKVETFNQYITEAYPEADCLVLDCELVLVDKTGKPLPFGSLGKHKKKAHEDAKPCLFVFDCMQYNDRSLLSSPLRERRAVLQEKMTEVPSRIQLSHLTIIKRFDELESLVHDTFSQDVEGLVIKSDEGQYESGKRRWMKLKKDLFNSKMADTVDLVVLGGYYGKGRKGGLLSSFLCGCVDPSTQQWYTVTKASTGLSDSVLKAVQTQLNLVQIDRNPDKVPSWLHVKRNMVPDYVVTCPQESLVWEIVGGGFTKSSVHTASGVSLRFPRIVRIRWDKSWKESTDLAQLQILARKYENG